MAYKKSQTGWIIIFIFVPVILSLYLAYANQWGNNPLPFIPFLVLTLTFVVIFLLFYKLTITIGKNDLQLIYGIGLIRFKFNIDAIEKTEVIKTPWYYGLGIRITPKGMLYNIQGSKAIKIEYIHMREKKSVMIGTPEPERLKKVVEDMWSEF